MKKQIDSKYISQVTAALMISDAKSAVRYLDDKTIVRVCAFNCVELPKKVILKPWPKKV